MERLCWHKQLFFNHIYFSYLVPCLPGINKIILMIRNFSPCFVLLDDVRCGRESLWISRDVPGIVQLVYTKVYYSTKLIGWLCLDCVLHIASSEKHWNSNRICPSLNIRIQMETFMGNYINTLVSWVPSKYHKSCYSQLDKTHFRAVVRKVNYKVSLQSLCFFLAKGGLFFILLYFVLALAWLERALLLTCCR